MSSNKVTFLYFFVYVSISFALLFPNHTLGAQASLSNDSVWTTWKEKDDIKVAYQQVENSELIEIKVNGIIKSTLSGFLLFIQDTDNIALWLHNASSSEILQKGTGHKNLFITYFKSYWPVTERYILVNSNHWQNTDLSLEIEMTDVNDEQYLHADIIKIKVIKAHWRLAPISKEHIKIEYNVIADPKGRIPLWLTKRIALRSLWKTMNNMQEQLPRSKWQKQSLPYIKEK